MSLIEIEKAIDTLTDEEFDELSRIVDEKARERAVLAVKKIPPQERIARLKAAAAEIREGFSDEEWAQVEHDINAKHIERMDEAEWRD